MSLFLLIKFSLCHLIWKERIVKLLVLVEICLMCKCVPRTQSCRLAYSSTLFCYFLNELIDWISFLR